MINKTYINFLNQCCQALNTCVFLGFDADPSSNIASRIRGPNVSYSLYIYSFPPCIKLLSFVCVAISWFFFNQFIKITFFAFDWIVNYFPFVLDFTTSTDSNVWSFFDISKQLGEIVFCWWCFFFYMQDQYINHIMNETGATVLLGGRSSGNAVGVHSDGTANYVNAKYH